MRLALVIRFQNDAHWLNLHLRYMAQSPHIDGIVGINGGSKDGSGTIAAQLKARFNYLKFNWDFAAQSNALLDHARELGYTHVILVDPDEVISLQGIHKLRKIMEQHAHVVSCDRIHFASDRLHWVPSWSPDITPRAFSLDHVDGYKGPVHEVLMPKNSGVYNGNVFIHHFGWITPITEAKLQLKLENYDRLTTGQPAITALTGKEKKHGYPPYVPYLGKHILDPHIIGIHAPF